MKQRLVSGLTVFFIALCGTQVSAQTVSGPQISYARIFDIGNAFQRPLKAGQIYSAAFVIRNSGDSPGSAGFTISYPATLSAQPMADGAVVDPLNHTVSFPNFNLPAGASTIRTFIYKVADNLAVDALVNRSSFQAQLTGDSSVDSTVVDYPLIFDVAESLAISITDGLDSINPGATMLYTITVANHGVFAENGEYVVAGIPPNCSFVSATNGGIATRDRTGTRDIVAFYGTNNQGFNLLPGQSATLQFTLKLANPLPTAAHSAVTVVASIFNGGTNGVALQSVQASDTDSIQGVGPGGYDLGINLTDGLDSIHPGATMLYTMVTTNRGNESAPGVMAQAKLPANCSLISATDGGSLANNAIVFPAFDLPPGASATRQFTLQFNSGIGDTTQVVVDATATGSSPNFNAEAFDIDRILNFPGPDLAADITPSVFSVNVGQTLSYLVLFGNRGNADSTGVMSSATVPANTTFVSASDGATFSNGLITWPTTALTVGQVIFHEFKVTVASSPGGDGTFHSIAALHDDSTHGADLNSADNVAQSTNSIATTSPQFNLSITDGVDSIHPGATLLYTLNVSNVGTADATSILLTTNLPANTTLVSSPNGATVQNGAIVFPLFNLAQNAAVVCQFTLKYADNPPSPLPASLAVTARVSDNGNDTVEATDTDAIFITPPPPPPPQVEDLALSLSSTPATVPLNGSATITLTVSNHGNVDVAHVNLNCAVYAPLAPSAVSDAGTIVLQPHIPPIVQYPDFSLAAGATITRTFVLTATSTSVSSGRLQAAVGDAAPSNLHPEATPGDNSVEKIIGIGQPLSDLDVALTAAANVASVQPGGQIVYTITVTNPSTTTSTNTMVNCSTDLAFEFVSASDGGGIDPNNPYGNLGIIFPSFTLNPGQSVVRTFTLLVPANTTSTIVAVQIYVNTGTQVDINPDNNHAFPNTPIVAAPPAAPSITSGPTTSGAVIAGAPVTFSVSATDNDANKALTYTWDFGDGTQGLGATVAHTFSSAGNYLVSITVSDDFGTDFSTLAVNVAPAGASFQLNTLKGTFALKRNNADVLLFAAQINLPSGFSAAGKKVSVQIANYTYMATLNSKGAFRDAQHNLSVQPAGAAWMITLKTTRQNLKSALAPTAQPAPKTQLFLNQHFALNVDGHLFVDDLDLNYITGASAATLFYANPNSSKQIRSGTEGASAGFQRFIGPDGIQLDLPQTNQRIVVTKMMLRNASIQLPELFGRKVK